VPEGPALCSRPHGGQPSGQQHDLAVSVPLAQLAIGVANPSQREGSRDRYLEAPVRDEPGELGEQRSAVDRVGALPVDAESRHGLVVDDRVDPLRRDTQSDRQVDIAAAERVDGRVDDAAGRGADPVGLPVALGHRHVVVAAQPVVMRSPANPITVAPARQTSWTATEPTPRPPPPRPRPSHL